MIHENRLRTKLDELGCTHDVFCLLAGISPTRWSRAMRGVIPLTGPECETFSKLVEELSRLAGDAAPYPISFRNPQIIKSLLEDYRAGRRWIPICIGPEPGTSGHNSKTR